MAKGSTLASCLSPSLKSPVAFIGSGMRCTPLSRAEETITHSCISGPSPTHPSLSSMSQSHWNRHHSLGSHTGFHPQAFAQADASGWTSKRFSLFSIHPTSSLGLPPGALRAALCGLLPVEPIELSGISHSSTDLDGS